jgi:GxxExxY protein
MNEISGHIIDAALHIHKALGPGLLESAYEAVLAHELRRRGLHVRRQHPVPIEYDEVRLEIGFRADLLVDNAIIVEVKSVEAIAPVHKMQLLTYLRLSDKRLGLLINFNVALIKDGIWRVVNGFNDSAETQSLKQATSPASPPDRKSYG